MYLQRRDLEEREICHRGSMVCHKPLGRSVCRVLIQKASCSGSASQIELLFFSQDILTVQLTSKSSPRGPSLLHRESTNSLIYCHCTEETCLSVIP